MIDSFAVSADTARAGEGKSMHRIVFAAALVLAVPVAGSQAGAGDSTARDPANESAQMDMAVWTRCLEDEAMKQFESSLTDERLIDASVKKCSSRENKMDGSVAVAAGALPTRPQSARSLSNGRKPY